MTTDLETMFRSLQTSLAAHRPDGDGAADADSGQATVPVTIVTGFLGAGKTTLLAALLQNPPTGCSVRAVVNDVGELGLDPSLLVNGSALDVELSNGCGCCAINDDLAATLDRMARFEPDLLVLEASGVTDPFAVAQIIEASPRLALDRTVAVIDALMVADLLGHQSMGGREPDDGLVDGTSIGGELSGSGRSMAAGSPLGPIIQRQLDAADAVVMSRADLVAAEDAAEVMAALAEHVPGRTIAPSSLTAPASAVLHPGAVRGAALPTTAGTVEHERSDGHLVAVTFDQQATAEHHTVVATLATLPPSILRIKGILHTDAGPVIIQSTPSGHTITPATSTPEGQAPPHLLTEPRSAGAGVATPTGRITIVATNREAAHLLAATLSC